MFVRLIQRIAQPILRCQRIQFSPALTILNNRLIIHNLTQIRIPIINELTEKDQDEELPYIQIHQVRDSINLTSE